ncbi:hypothetical protein [Micromonospora sp. NPDC051141]|uniref:hypothetical protein n=1 Tax=Micromonospora sp. NPDC051141 TaxID=3364284 RepID=UPI0037B23AAE
MVIELQLSRSAASSKPVTLRKDLVRVLRAAGTRVGHPPCLAVVFNKIGQAAA